MISDFSIAVHIQVHYYLSTFFPTMKAHLLLLSNTVVLLAFLLREARGVIFTILIFFNKVIQKSD